MGRKTNAIAAAATMAGLTSCFQSNAPLSDPDPGVTDENLKGVWHAVVQKNDVYLHIIPLTPPLMKVIRVTHINVGGFYNMDELEMFPTFVEGKKFMNLKFLMPKEPGTGRGELEPRFTFVEYAVSKDGVLTVRGLDYDGWNKAITGKRVKGAAWETTWGSNVELKDTGKNILEYFSSKDAERDFRVLGDFRKVISKDANRSR